MPDKKPVFSNPNPPQPDLPQDPYSKLEDIPSTREEAIRQWNEKIKRGEVKGDLIYDDTSTFNPKTGEVTDISEPTPEPRLTPEEIAASKPEVEALRQRKVDFILKNLPANAAGNVAIAKQTLKPEEFRAFEDRMLDFVSLRASMWRTKTGGREGLEKKVIKSIAPLDDSLPAKGLASRMAKREADISAAIKKKEAEMLRKIINENVVSGGKQTYYSLAHYLTDTASLQEFNKTIDDQILRYITTGEAGIRNDIDPEVARDWQSAVEEQRVLDEMQASKEDARNKAIQEAGFDPSNVEGMEAAAAHEMESRPPDGRSIIGREEDVEDVSLNNTDNRVYIPTEHDIKLNPKLDPETYYSHYKLNRSKKLIANEFQSLPEHLKEQANTWIEKVLGDPKEELNAKPYIHNPAITYYEAGIIDLADKITAFNSKEHARYMNNVGNKNFKTRYFFQQNIKEPKSSYLLKKSEPLPPYPDWLKAAGGYIDVYHGTWKSTGIPMEMDTFSKKEMPYLNPEDITPAEMGLTDVEARYFDRLAENIRSAYITQDMLIKDVIGIDWNKVIAYDAGEIQKAGERGAYLLQHHEHLTNLMNQFTQATAKLNLGTTLTEEVRGNASLTGEEMPEQDVRSFESDEPITRSTKYNADIPSKTIYHESDELKAFKAKYSLVLPMSDGSTHVVELGQKKAGSTREMATILDRIYSDGIHIALLPTSADKIEAVQSGIENYKQTMSDALKEVDPRTEKEFKALRDKIESQTGIAKTFAQGEQDAYLKDKKLSLWSELRTSLHAALVNPDIEAVAETLNVDNKNIQNALDHVVNLEDVNRPVDFTPSAMSAYIEHSDFDPNQKRLFQSQVEHTHGCSLR